MKLFRKIDGLFLSDTETGETAPLSDKLFFYGVLGFPVVMGIVFTVKLITF